MRKILLGLTSVLFSVSVNADVLHPENSSIAGGVVSSYAICFNNDGEVIDDNECPGVGNPVDEGFVFLKTSTGHWAGGLNSGINGCGTTAVNPVSSANCPFYTTTFAGCTAGDRVLIQTTKSGHFWSVRANADCSGIWTPEGSGLEPCMSTDAFSPDVGCTPAGNQTSIEADGGYLKLETYRAQPPNAHCAVAAHEGRMVVDTELDGIWFCTENGWQVVSATP